MLNMINSLSQRLEILPAMEGAWEKRTVSINYELSDGSSGTYVGLAITSANRATHHNLRLSVKTVATKPAELILPIITSPGTNLRLVLNNQFLAKKQIEGQAKKNNILGEISHDITSCTEGVSDSTLEIFLLHPSDDIQVCIPLEPISNGKAAQVNQKAIWPYMLPAILFYGLLFPTAFLALFLAVAQNTILSKSNIVSILLELAPSLAITFSILGVKEIRLKVFPSQRNLFASIRRFRLIMVILLMASASITFYWTSQYVYTVYKQDRAHRIRESYIKLINNYFTQNGKVSYLYDAFNLLPWRIEAQFLIYSLAEKQDPSLALGLSGLCSADGEVFPVVIDVIRRNERSFCLNKQSPDGVQDPILWFAGMLHQLDVEVEISREYVRGEQTSKKTYETIFHRLRALQILQHSSKERAAEAELLAHILRLDITAAVLKDNRDINLGGFLLEMIQLDMTQDSVGGSSTYQSSEFTRVASVLPDRNVLELPYIEDAVDGLSKAIEHYEEEGFTPSSHFYLEAVDHIAQYHAEKASSAARLQQSGVENSQHLLGIELLEAERAVDAFIKVLRTRYQALNEFEMMWLRDPGRLGVLWHTLYFKDKDLLTIAQQEIVSSQRDSEEFTSLYKQMIYQQESGENSLGFNTMESFKKGSYKEFQLNMGMNNNNSKGIKDFIDNSLKTGWRYNHESN